MKSLPFVGDEHLTTARADGARWLEHVVRWRPHDPDQIVTGDHEVAELLLAGTFDLVGGSTAWPAASPQGKKMNLWKEMREKE